MTRSSLAIKIGMALIGCFAGAYVGDELLGGGALGWAVAGAIVAGCCYPLFKTLSAWRQSRR